MRHWPMHVARSRLSEVLREAVEAPQVITVRGREAGVVLSMAAYQQLVPPGHSPVEFFRNSPLASVDLDLSRPQESPRLNPGADNEAL